MWKDNIRRRKYLKRKYFSGSTSKISKSRQMVKLSKYAFIGAIGIFILSLVIIPIFALTLPSPENVVRKEGFSTKILDRNGEALYDIYTQQGRTPVTLDEIPVFLKQATIAIEDKKKRTIYLMLREKILDV